MIKPIQAIRGMNDCLPTDTPLWQWVENQIRTTLASYGYQEIRMPLVEDTGLFSRAIGEVTDVVEKEMFTFNDRDGESITLRPEGTAGCVRAGIQNGLLYNQEQRLWYMGAMFRYERPQKGRYRQFNQLGVEIFGIPNPQIDAELILLTARLWKNLGISDNVTLQLNSIGSLEARKNYRQALVNYLTPRYDELDEDCQRRLTTNPLRILDSKNQSIQALLNHAPKLQDYLDEESKAHFTELCRLLDGLGVRYELNPKLVRGLDYYNKTVFEWVTDSLGAQGTICGGGRYDGLVEQLGGHSTSSVGFAIGLERLVLLVQAVNTHVCLPSPVDFYIIFAGENTSIPAFFLAEKLRTELPSCRTMLNGSGGNFKKQFKRADKSGASIALVLGEEEVEAGNVVVKFLRDDRPQEVVDIAQICEFLNHLSTK